MFNLSDGIATPNLPLGLHYCKTPTLTIPQVVINANALSLESFMDYFDYEDEEDLWDEEVDAMFHIVFLTIEAGLGRRSFPMSLFKTYGGHFLGYHINTVANSYIKTYERVINKPNYIYTELDFNKDRISI